MNDPNGEIIRGEVSTRKMYAGGMSYVSECIFELIGRVSAEAVPIDAMERKTKRVLVDIVENFIR
jgi:hypothetical protein